MNSITSKVQNLIDPTGNGIAANIFPAAIERSSNCRSLIISRGRSVSITDYEHDNNIFRMNLSTIDFDNLNRENTKIIPAADLIAELKAIIEQLEGTKF